MALLSCFIEILRADKFPYVIDTLSREIKNGEAEEILEDVLHYLHLFTLSGLRWYVILRRFSIWAGSYTHLPSALITTTYLLNNVGIKRKQDRILVDITW
jgi:hypothetical protein